MEASAKAYFAFWMQLATTPCGSYLDSSKMFWPVVLPCKSRSRAAAKMRAVKLENESDKTSAGDSAKEYNLQEKNLDVPTNITKIIVNADSEKSVTHTRVVTATALGIFASKLPATSLHVVVDTLWSDLTSFSGVQRQVNLLHLLFP